MDVVVIAADFASNRRRSVHMSGQVTLRSGRYLCRFTCVAQKVRVRSLCVLLPFCVLISTFLRTSNRKMNHKM